MQYFVMEAERQRIHCLLDRQPMAVEDKNYRLLQGLPFGDTFPVNEPFFMSHNDGGINAPDLVDNIFGYQIISQSFKDFLEKESGFQKSEFHPVIIKNHKEKALEGLYYVMNLLDTYDCIDEKKSMFNIDPVEPIFFQWMDRLVLDVQKLGENTHIFRLKKFPYIVLVSEVLKQLIESSKFDGLKFTPTDIDYSYK